MTTLTAPSPATANDLASSARDAASFLKTFAHEGRLMLLCHLGDGEKSVSQLEKLMQLRQATVSQMLARLREDQLVMTRREGKTIYYRLSGTDTQEMISLLHQLFCAR